MVHNTNQRHTGSLGFRGRKLLNFPEFLPHFEENELESFTGRWFFLRNLPKHIGKFFLNFLNLVQIAPSPHFYAYSSNAETLAKD